MKNKIKFLGIAALALVVTFGFLACTDEVGDETTVKIVDAGWGYIEGDTLTAVVDPNPDGNYKYQWYKGGVVQEKETDKTLKAPEVAKYYVVVNGEIKSEEIEVFKIPAAGKWEMKSGENSNGDVSFPENPNKYVDEYIALAKTSFHLTIFSKGSTTEEYKTVATQTDGDYWKFPIIKWEKVAGVAGYPNGLKLNISKEKIEQAGGYSEKIDTIYIYATADLKTFIRTRTDNATEFAPLGGVSGGDVKGDPTKARKYTLPATTTP